MTPTNTIANPTLLAEAITAARMGQKAAARRILIAVTTDNPGSEQAHLWLAAVAESPEEAVAALERVLLLNPGNRQAVNALAVQRLRVAPRPAKPGEQPASAATHEPLASRPPARTGPAAPPSPANASSSLGALAAATNQPPAPSTPHPAALPSTPAPSQTSTQAAAKAPPRKVWVCPLCEHEAEKARNKCPKCSGILVFDDLSALAENRDANEEMLRRGIVKWQTKLTDGPSFDANVNIARAYCNMNQSATALKFLQEAGKLRPHDSEVRNAIEALRNRRLVLAVDDSATVRKFVATSLERKGYRVLSASDGVQAIAMAAESKPDLVLLDITMPKIDGYEVCRLIRKTPDIKRVPVVMLSGRDGFFDKIKGKVAGSTDYITKPFDVKTLTGVLERYIVRELRVY